MEKLYYKPNALISSSAYEREPSLSSTLRPKSFHVVVDDTTRLNKFSRKEVTDF